MFQDHGKRAGSTADQIRTDPALIRAIRNPSNYEAWKTFESRYAPIIRSFCISRGLSHHDASDVAQEVFLRVSKYGFADRYDPEQGTFRSYLFRVTRGVASAIELEKLKHPSWDKLVVESEENWNEVWRTQTINLAIARVTASVSPQSRQVLSLTLRGLKPVEIAESTGLSKHMIYKSRQRLRTKIESTIREFSLDFNEI